MTLRLRSSVYGCVVCVWVWMPVFAVNEIWTCCVRWLSKMVLSVTIESRFSLITKRPQISKGAKFQFALQKKSTHVRIWNIFHSKKSIWNVCLCEEKNGMCAWDVAVHTRKSNTSWDKQTNAKADIFFHYCYCWARTKWN